MHSDDEQEGDDNDKPLAKEDRVLSLGQDLVYTVTNGKVATPKHVGLAMAVKHKTNSRQLVTLLNHAGHGRVINK